MMSNLPYLLACIMSFAFSLSIMALLCVHTWLICNNTTSIESRSLWNPFIEETGSTGVIRMMLKNAESTFGIEEPWWRWLLPV
jgi:hypothetical protein